MCFGSLVDTLFVTLRNPVVRQTDVDDHLSAEMFDGILDLKYILKS